MQRGRPPRYCRSMAKTIELAKHQFRSGAVPVFRGDDWRLRGAIMVKDTSGNGLPFDATGAAATAFFPKDPSGSIAVPVDFVEPKDGAFEVLVPASASIEALVTSATSVYFVVSNADGITTVESANPVLEIKDRGFQS